MQQEGNNLNIAGAGRSNGGKYDRVDISGTGTVTGELVCRDLDVNGHGSFEAYVQCETADINGLATFRQQLSSDRMEINGMATVTGELNTSDSLQINGRLKTLGPVHAGLMVCNGMLAAEKDIEAERFEGTGSLQIRGLLNANRIDMRLVTRCQVQEIGCGTIVVRRNTGWLFGLGGNGALVCSTLEGDEIDIEGVQATTVRGDSVTVGEGCQIDRVEYRETYKVHPNAFVKEAVKID